MNVIHAFLLGIVEGLTEFLPISSTFHLIFASKFLGVPNTEFSKFFDVFIQSAAILPVVLLYFKEWFQNKKLLLKVGVSFLPTAVVGFVLHKVIKDVFFETDMLMIASFAVVGVLFIVLEGLLHKRKIELQKDLSHVTYVDAVLIGLFQAAAVLPGVSRAGAVIVGMMLLGIRRSDGAKYSFMLAVPTILAAGAYDMLKTDPAVVFNSANLVPLLAGSIGAFLSALFITRWFIEYLRKNSLKVFGVYRLFVAGILIIFGFWR